jgi:prepilin-type N-terminal cleavage/methylation domain-containing protein
MCTSSLFAGGQRSKGFTLVEFIVVLGIVAALVTASLPIIAAYISPPEPNRSVQAIYTALINARKEAILRAKSITICASSDGIECSQLPASWSAGWIMFEDANGLHNIGFKDTVIKTYVEKNKKIKMDEVNELTSVTFGVGGALSPSPRRSVLRISEINSSINSQCVVVNYVGRVEVTSSSTNPLLCPLAG